MGPTAVNQFEREPARSVPENMGRSGLYKTSTDSGELPL
jgi:hypothetical protein